MAAKPDIPAHSGNGSPDHPTLIASAVARLGLSIRTKLLIAFLGVTALMVGLALFGLMALQQSNARTEKLLRDQERIAYYNTLYGYLGDLIVMAFAVGIDRDETRTNDRSVFRIPGELLNSRVLYTEWHLGQGKRSFGKPDTADAAILDAIRDELRAAKGLVLQIKARRAKGDYEGAGQIGTRQFAPIALELQRDVYTFVQSIEAEMAETARSTALAYVASRRLVTASALVAIGLALMLGYAISASLIWPVRRIGQAFGLVSGGDFQARVSVPNRDELGELAGHVNATSERLGALYTELDAQRAELAVWNTQLEEKVAAQVEQIERTNRLRRFLPAQVADLIVAASDDEELLGSRRDEVTVLFADLRGFTAYAGAVEPKTVIAALNAFHAMAGPLIEAHGGTLERFLGDGLMVLFNAPLPCPDHANKALALARDMRKAFPAVMLPYQTDTYTLGLGIGVATGKATLGQIGFEDRLDYSAIGTTPNMAARLCDQARDGQVLISEATANAGGTTATPVGPFRLKGITGPTGAFELN